MATDTAIIGGLLESITGAARSLIRLRCDDPAALLEHLRQHSIRTGQSLYAWNENDGLRSLRDGEVPVPGSRRFHDALRYVIQSAHFGVYFFDAPESFDANAIPLLKQAARLAGERVRRVALLGESALPPGVEACALDWNAASTRKPRLRDGRWVRA